MSMGTLLARRWLVGLLLFIPVLSWAAPIDLFRNISRMPLARFALATLPKHSKISMCAIFMITGKAII